MVPVEVVRFRSPRVGHAGLQHDHAVHVYVATWDRFGALLGIGVGPRVSVALAVAAKHRAAPGLATFSYIPQYTLVNWARFLR